MNNLSPELHIAQQFRRDKLRIQNSSNNNPPQLQEYFPNNIEQLSPQQQGPNLDLLQVRTIRNNEANMLDEKPQPQPQPLYSSSEFMSLSWAARTMMPHLYGSSSSSPNSTSSKEPHDWRVNYATSSVVNEINDGDNNNVSTTHYNVKPNCNNNVLLDSMSSQNCGEMHNPNSASSNSIYHNALQDIFNKASNSSIGGHGSEMASSLMHWGGVNNNAQNYGGISANLWINRGIYNDNNTLGWNNNPLGLTVKKAINDSHSNPHQGLSLSLSSNSQQSNKPFGEGSASDDPQLGNNNNNNNALKSTMMKPSINVSGDCSAGKSSSIHHQDHMGLSSSPNTSSYRNVGPLGPFTGYATILKSSRFLKPCQELLDEYCCQQSGFSSSKPDQNKSCDDVPEWVSRDRVSGASTSSVADAVINVLDETNGGVGGSNGGSSSSSMFYDSKAHSSNNGGAATSNFCVSSSSSRPECQKNKAKLVYMQEEVTRRYKQYYQQMQMVVSSFESVAGLNSATPYISLALKSVSRHFRCLKNTISDQLKLMCEALGEDFSIPMTSPVSKFDTSNITRLRCKEQSFQRNNCGNMDFIEQQQQHSWRPQRGLPERSVAILKAWLFEHFLHPYPTDTDKHMLATQTGLSRNQVSNWFINARVRVWKPMVEEIHMLETKGGMEGANRSKSKNEGITSASSHHHHHPRVDDHQHINMFGNSHVTNSIQERQFQCLQMGSSSSLARANEEGQWNNQDKRSKLESHITSDMADHGTLMGFLPFRHHASGLEVGGHGPVSLTLGLRHGDVALQQQQQQQLQHEEQLQHHFGGHMIHDFVG